jgi:hypothetical protein
MSEFIFNFVGFTLLGAVAIVLVMGIYTLFKGGNTSKKYSNKLMQLRVLFQFIAIIVLVVFAYFFKN